MLTGQGNEGSAHPFLRAAGTRTSPQKDDFIFSPSLLVWGLECLPLLLLPQ